MRNTNNFSKLAGVFDVWLAEEAECAVGSLAEVSRYTLLLPGKRLRPVLCLAVGEMLDVPLSLLRLPCLALEYLHAYSLMHDDLPALDDDNLRRGHATAHVTFGEAAAVLAADRLHAEAYYLLASDDSIPLAVRLSLLKCLSLASIELCDGQYLDILSERGNSEQESIAELERRHLLKTGALIRAAVLAPSYFLKDAEQDAVRQQLESFARNFGLLFQITDDILDATSSEKVMGKTNASDQKTDKATYLSVCGLEKARELAEQSAKAAEDSLEDFGEKANFLKSLCNSVLKRDS